MNNEWQWQIHDNRIIIDHHNRIIIEWSMIMIHYTIGVLVFLAWPLQVKMELLLLIFSLDSWCSGSSKLCLLRLQNFQPLENILPLGGCFCWCGWCCDFDRHDEPVTSSSEGFLLCAVRLWGCFGKSAPCQRVLGCCWASAAVLREVYLVEPSHVLYFYILSFCCVLHVLFCIQLCQRVKRQTFDSVMWCSSLPVAWLNDNRPLRSSDYWLINWSISYR